MEQCYSDLDNALSSVRSKDTRINTLENRYSDDMKALNNRINELDGDVESQENVIKDQEDAILAANQTIKSKIKQIKFKETIITVKIL